MSDIGNLADNIQKAYGDIPKEVSEFLTSPLYKQKDIVSKTTDKAFLETLLKYTENDKITIVIRTRLEQLSQ